MSGHPPLDAVINAIMDGAYDGKDKRLYDAIRARRTIHDEEMTGTFRKDDRIVVVSCRPSYLIGKKGTVAKVGRTRIGVRFDPDQDLGSYEGAGIVTIGASQVKRVDA